MNNPQTTNEAYVATILDDLSGLGREVEVLFSAVNVRIGITQEIIESQLIQANVSLIQFTQYHVDQSKHIENQLTQAKLELSTITNEYLTKAITKSLVDAQFKIEQTAASKRNEQLVLTALVSTSIAIIVSASLIGTLYLSGFISFN